MQLIILENLHDPRGVIKWKGTGDYWYNYGMWPFFGIIWENKVNGTEFHYIFVQGSVQYSIALWLSLKVITSILLQMVTTDRLPFLLLVQELTDWSHCSHLEANLLNIWIPNIFGSHF